MSKPIEFVDRAAAAAHLKVSPGTLARWAMLRQGPRYHLLGGRAWYRVSDLDAYIDAQARDPLTSVQTRNHEQKLENG